MFLSMTELSKTGAIQAKLEVFGHRKREDE
jgi:hypothetical protein